MLSRIFDTEFAQRHPTAGFKKSHRVYLRWVNDVLQLFSLKKLQGRTMYTITFSVVPMCCRFLPVSDGMYDMSHFTVDTEIAGGWRCDPIKPDGVRLCVEAMLDVMDRFMIPFFECCLDCKSSLPEMIKLEEAIEENRKEYLRSMGLKDRAGPLQTRLMFDPNKYYMSLKAGDEVFARAFLELMIRHYKNGLSDMRSRVEPQQPEAVKNRYEEACAYYSEHLEHLTMGDRGFFERLISHNEHTNGLILEERYRLIRSTGDGSLS